jgi:LysR family cyn operon transcriptional activator
MELRHLRYFQAVAEEHSFRRAAERLFISQPALSQQIRQLEEELGVPLFDRIGKRVRPTAAGELLLGYARRVLHELDEAQRALAEFEGLARGTLALAVVQTVNSYLIPAALARFIPAYPAIAIRIEELPAGQIEAGIIGGQIDLGIGFAPASAAEIEAEPLFDEELVLIVRSDHRLAGQERLPVGQLEGVPLALLAQTFCTRRLVDQCAQLAGARLDVRVEMNAIEGLLATVRATGLATVLPALALRTTAGAGLCAVALCEPVPRRSVGLLWQRGGYRCAAARAFAATVRQCCAELAPAWTAHQKHAILPALASHSS